MSRIRRKSSWMQASLIGLIGLAPMSDLRAQYSAAGPVAPQQPVEPPTVDPHRPAYAAPYGTPPGSAAGASSPWLAPSSDAQFVDRYGANAAATAQAPSAATPANPYCETLNVSEQVAQTAAVGQAGDAVLRGCIVKLVDKTAVSVQEPGLITALEVREGMMVEADAQVGRVGDSQARMAVLVAQAEYKIAQDKAGNDIEVRYAEAAAKVAEFEYRAALQANERAPASIAQVKLQELALAFEKAQRQIEQAKHNLAIFKEEAEAKRVQVEAAEDDVRRRQIASPIAGEVIEVPFHVGEFVKPGDAIFHVIRLDQVAVEGFLSAGDFAPGEVVGKPVLVDAVLAHGRRQQFAGKVVFAHPEIDARRQFRIKAEVTNIAEAGQYLLRPGQEVDMTIQLHATSAPTPAAATDNLAAPPAAYERR